MLISSIFITFQVLLLFLTPESVKTGTNEQNRFYKNTYPSLILFCFNPLQLPSLDIVLSLAS